MTRLSDQPKAFALVPAMAVTCGVMIGLSGAAIAALHILGQARQMPEALAMAGLCLGAALISLLPVHWRSTAAVEGAAQGFILGMLIRMAICLGGLLLIGYKTSLELSIMAGWMAGWYMMLLAVEAGLLVRYLRLRSAISHSNKEAAAC
jgi:hypothetical protein